MPKIKPATMISNIENEIIAITNAEMTNEKISALIDSLKSFTDYNADDINDFLNGFLQVYKRRHLNFLNTRDIFVFDKSITISLFSQLYLFELVLSSLFFIAKRDSEGMFASTKYKGVVDEFGKLYRKEKSVCHESLKSKFYFIENKQPLELETKIELLQKLNSHSFLDQFLSIIGVVTFSLGNTEFSFSKINKKLNLKDVGDLIRFLYIDQNKDVIAMLLTYCNEIRIEQIIANQNDLLSLFQIVGYESFTTNQTLLDLLLSLTNKEQYLLDPTVALSSETLKKLRDPIISKDAKNKLLTTLLFDHFVLNTYTTTPKTIAEFYEQNPASRPVLVNGYLIKKDDHCEPFENFLLRFQSREILLTVLKHINLTTQDLNTIYAYPAVFISIMNKLGDFKVVNNNYEIDRELQIQFIEFIASTHWADYWKLTPLMQVLKAEHPELLKIVVPRLLLAFQEKFTNYNYSESALIYTFEFFKAYKNLLEDKITILIDLEKSFTSRTTFSPSWNKQLSELYSLEGREFIQKAKEIKSSLAPNKFSNQVFSEDKIETILNHPLGKAVITYALQHKLGSDNHWVENFISAYWEQRLSEFRNPAISYSKVVELLQYLNKDFVKYSHSDNFVFANLQWLCRGMAIAALKTFIENREKNLLSHNALRILSEITKDLELFTLNLHEVVSSAVAETKKLQVEFQETLDIKKQELNVLHGEYAKQAIAFIGNLNHGVDNKHAINNWLVETRRVIGEKIFKDCYVSIFSNLMIEIKKFYEALHLDLQKQSNQMKCYFSDEGITIINQICLLNKLINEFIINSPADSSYAKRIREMQDRFYDDRINFANNLINAFSSMEGDDRDKLVEQLKDYNVCRVLGVYLPEEAEHLNAKIHLESLNLILGLIKRKDEKDNTREDVFQTIVARDNYFLIPTNPADFTQKNLIECVNLLSFNVLNGGNLSESRKVIHAFISLAQRDKNILGEPVYFLDGRFYETSSTDFSIIDWYGFVIPFILAKINSYVRFQEILDNFKNIEIKTSIQSSYGPRSSTPLSVISMGGYFYSEYPLFELFKSPEMLLFFLKRINFKLSDFTNFPSLFYNILRHLAPDNKNTSHHAEANEFIRLIIDMKPSYSWYEEMLNIFEVPNKKPYQQLLIEHLVRHLKVESARLNENIDLESLTEFNNKLNTLKKFASLKDVQITLQNYSSKGLLELLESKPGEANLLWEQVRLGSLIFGDSKKSWMLANLKRLIEIDMKKDFVFLTLERLAFLENNQDFQYLLDPLFNDKSVEKMNTFYERFILCKLQDSIDKISTISLTSATKLLTEVNEDFIQRKYFGSDVFYKTHTNIYVKSIEFVKLIFDKFFDNLLTEKELEIFIQTIQPLRLFQQSLSVQPPGLWTLPVPKQDIENLLERLKARQKSSGHIVVSKDNSIESSISNFDL